MITSSKLMYFILCFIGILLFFTPTSSAFRVLNGSVVTKQDKSENVMKQNEIFQSKELFEMNLNPNEITSKFITDDFQITVTTIYFYYYGFFHVILYILFGIVLEIRKVRAVLMHPIGPGIAFVGNWIFAPLVSHNFRYKKK